MSGGINWVKWCPRDFQASTRGWPFEARGVYRELLDAQFDLGSLPEEESELRTIVGCSQAHWNKAWIYVESKFPLWGGRRLNPRMKEEREDSESRHAEAVENGRKGADKRWGAHSNPNSNHNHNHNHSKKDKKESRQNEGKGEGKEQEQEPSGVDL